MIGVGVGGWTYAPWRGTFYPPGLPQAQELAHAARRLTAIEINGTFYRTQSPASFRKWAEEVPDGFVFCLKGHRVVTNRKALAEAGPAIASFLGSGATELGPKLGPINWQLAPTKRYDPDEMAAFLDLLPSERDGLRLRHAIEVRHPSFADPRFVEQARERSVAIVFADHDSYPVIPDLTANFTYARLQRSREAEPEGYGSAELDSWAAAARDWAAGRLPAGLTSLSATAPSPEQARDAFLFFIAGAKARAPAAAEGLIRRLSPAQGS